jgi:glycerophosphoryl diester phosphodiesterase
MITASHSDSPCFKVKDELAGASYTRLATEKYGGMIHYTWLDRPLSVAGRLVVKTADGVKSVLVNLDKADRYFDLIVPVLEKTGTARQIIMKGGKPADQVLELYGKYLDEILYMPVVNLHKEGAEELMNGYMADLKPYAYELVYQDDNQLEYSKSLKTELDGKALIWYNTLWDTLCGGHDDDLALSDPDAAYGYLIDTLGATIIQTDRAEYLLKYLRSRGLHE